MSNPSNTSLGRVCGSFELLRPHRLSESSFAFHVHPRDLVPGSRSRSRLAVSPPPAVLPALSGPEDFSWVMFLLGFSSVSRDGDWVPRDLSLVVKVLKAAFLTSAGHKSFLEVSRVAVVSV